MQNGHIHHMRHTATYTWRSLTNSIRYHNFRTEMVGTLRASTHQSAVQDEHHHVNAFFPLVSFRERWAIASQALRQAASPEWNSGPVCCALAAQVIERFHLDSCFLGLTEDSIPCIVSDASLVQDDGVASSSDAVVCPKDQVLSTDLATGSDNIGPPALFVEGDTNDAANTGGDEMVAFDDPRTWPKHWTAQHIKNLLKPFLGNGIAPDYDSLASLLKLGDFQSLSLLLRAAGIRRPPPQVDLLDYFMKHLRHTVKGAASINPERIRYCTAVKTVLSTTGVNSKVVCCCSPRGSGKTNLLMCLAQTMYPGAMEHGLVIVRCCDAAAHEKCDPSRQSWLELVRNGAAVEGLCELIRTHVASVTGRPQDPSCYSEPKQAYKMWMSETKKFFGTPNGDENMEPLILLDTCELLAQHEHNSLKRKASGKPYTALEALCFAVPAPHGIVVVGCDANITEPTNPATTAVAHVGPLLPFTEKSCQQANGAHPPLFHLAGGVPRLLCLCTTNQTISQGEPLTPKNADAFHRFFEDFSVTAKSQYPVQPTLFAQTYTCLLASSTKARVKGGDVIPVNPAWGYRKRALTYDEAATLSMGTYDPHTGRFMVPPITFGDAEVITKHSVPILPSQLHPFLDADVVARFGNYAATEFERLYVIPLMYAVYGRYLLASWEENTSEWVSLAKVFEGAVRLDQVPLLERYEVNLVGGVQSFSRTTTRQGSLKHAVMYCGETCGAHLCCRQTRKKGTGVPHAVPLLLRRDSFMAQQLRWDDRQKLVLSLATSHSHCTQPRNMVVLDANALSSHGWLFPSH
ncbi:Bodo-specific multi-copy gene family, putative [Bodo saltans]|uniref:Bodo-specific multi-copy gene family, putative n=1 Tax=Bodo saltans TaxID=75058 RepID=A0A0S4IK90_BODSA|nr:Bodo-specific multi-copy gene family, putative [Bodo saltans]|eukprot:CUE63824.1 Bodo-specific multi-copy gene family, putative [Bodo saltans]